MYDKKTFLMLSLLLAFFVQPLLAEETTTSKAESMATAPTGQAADLSTIKRGRLTEEQAISQLKYMMVEGWKRMEDELLERGSFKAFGLTLSPDGEFKPLYIDSQEDLPQDVQLAALAKNIEAIAQTRSVWGVGLMYVTGNVREDGSLNKRIAVVAEHIAGHARVWSYPYKLVDGEVKLGSPIEKEMKTIYFVTKGKR
jgi:hypothetical protein